MSLHGNSTSTSASNTDTDPLVVVDLFCGAGGFSTALMEFVADSLSREVRLYAINHSPHAIRTHRANHDAVRFNADIKDIDPDEVVEEDTVHLLMGGPSCTHFSKAKSRGELSEQKRSSPYFFLDWLRADSFDVERLLIENVEELRSWGPLDSEGRPTRDGSKFDAWTIEIEDEGYTLDWKILNAADYGDPQSRERLFILGNADGDVSFPSPTHSETGAGDTDEWRTAAEIIDWDDLGDSIWTRDLTNSRVHSPPKDSTLTRIAEGIRRHCSPALATAADTIEQMDRSEIKWLRQNRVVPSQYAETVAQAVDQPFFVCISQPTDTDYEPFLLKQNAGGAPNSLTEPLPTIQRDGNHQVVTAEPLVMPRNGPRGGLHSNKLYPPNARPIHTITAQNTDGYLVTPDLYQFATTHSPNALQQAVDPFLLKYYGNSDCQPVASEPLHTITTKDTFALIIPELYPFGLDINYRLLKPAELKRAQGFPDYYELCGTKTQRTEQIGNAVPVQTARRLIEHLLLETQDTPLTAPNTHTEPVA